MLEAAEHDIVFENGKFVVARHRQDRSAFRKSPSNSFNPRALPPGVEPGLFETGTFDGGERTYPNGCHIVEVEIDEDTGAVEIVRYYAVDDVGHMINPLLVEGQLHGGIAQGVGQALIENIVYDKSGQIVTGSFMDYGMPRADLFCAFELGENEVPTKTNPLGVKGAGKSGTVGALSSVMNAVNDALAAYRRALCADAGDAGEGLARDQGGARRRDGEAIGSDCIVWPGASSVAMTRTKG